MATTPNRKIISFSLDELNIENKLNLSSNVHLMSEIIGSELQAKIL